MPPNIFAIVLVLATISFLGNALRDVLGPRLRGGR